MRIEIETSTSSTWIIEARHGPIAVKLEVTGAVKDAHVDFQVHGTPADLVTNPIEPSKKTHIQLPDGGRIAEEAPPTLYCEMHVANGEAKFRLLNGIPHRQVVESPAPPAPPPVSAVSHKMTAIDSLAPTFSLDSANTTTIERVDHDQSPPAERAGSVSDAEKASMTNAGVSPLVSATLEPQPVAPSQVAQQTEATLDKDIEKMPNSNELTSKDLLDNHIAENTSSAKAPNDGIFAEQFQFCDMILRKLRKRCLDVIVSLFYEPFEWVNIADPQCQPIGISTIRQRLRKGEYATPENFREDIKLMIRNALTLNPPMNSVHEVCKALDRYFDEKWRDLPPLHSQATPDGEDDFDSDQERQRSIANMEEQILNMKSDLELLKRNATEPYKERRNEKNAAVPTASSSNSMSTQREVVKNGREKAEEPTDVDIELKNQKKRLVYSAMSEEVLQSIRKAMALIRNAKELPQSTLHEPNDLVIQPLRTPETTHARIAKRIDSRAVKRKRTDEEIETTEIPALEEVRRVMQLIAS